MKKNKMINAATCDARNVTEESLAGFDNITVNAAIVIVGERSKELLNKYAVTLNAASVLEVPDGQDITVKSANGRYEIGPDTDGTGIFLTVNGKLTVADGSLNAVKSFYRIAVNGKVLMPKSFEGCCTNLQVNGKAEYYPDGAVILKPDTEIDRLFVARAGSTLYYCSGNLFLLDTKIDVEKLLAKGLRFAAKKIVIAESLEEQLYSQFEESAEIIRVPDGSRHIRSNVELLPRTLRKYGTKLCVSGDVSIHDAEALSALEYLFADGTVSVSKDLEDAFYEIESVYDKLNVTDPEQGVISDRPAVTVDASIFKKYASGVRIEDCAKVRLGADLSPEDILEKIRISDCAIVTCSKEQEAAVNMIAQDVATIRVSGHKQADDEEAEDGTPNDVLGSLFGSMKDTQMINATEYTM